MEQAAASPATPLIIQSAEGEQQGEEDSPPNRSDNSAPTTSPNSQDDDDDDLQQHMQQRWMHWKRKFVEYYFRINSTFTMIVTDEQGTGWPVVFGLCTLVVIGLILGGILPGDSELYQHNTVGGYFSNAIGWTYFVGWSISFYPQILTNYRRKTTIGLSPDFCGLNVVGFACYMTYNLGLFFSTTIQKQYRQRHGPNSTISVQSNDVAFAVHAFVMASITFGQIGYYDGFEGLVGFRRRTRRRTTTTTTTTTTTPSKTIQIIAGMILASAALFPLLILIDPTKIQWLDYLYMLSYIKIGITLMKYIPQVILNYQRRSTVGWSIWNILLDFTGGLLSDLQLVLDCSILSDWTGITGNVAKLALGSVSVVFDIIFMVQHYILYSANTIVNLDGEDDDDDNLNFVEGEPLAAIDDVTL